MFSDAVLYAGTDVGFFDSREKHLARLHTEINTRNPWGHTARQEVHIGCMCVFICVSFGWIKGTWWKDSKQNER